jgi:hypothetical protein
VLANDSDPFDSPSHNLVNTAVETGPEHGTVGLNADGSFTYTPDAGYVGADSFTYRVIDDGGTANGGQDTSAPGTVSIFVDGTNLPPDALDATLYGLQNNSISSTLGATDPNHDYDDLDFVYEVGTGPANGTVTVNADGTFTYTPDTDFVGIDNFDFRVTDPFGDFDVATITVDLAQTFVPPEFQPDGGLIAKQPDVVGLSDGGFIVVWTTTDLDAGGPAFGDGASDGIFFQRYDGDGNKVSRDGLNLGDDVVQANTTATGSQQFARMVEFSDGQWLAVWHSSDGETGAGATGNAAFAQRYNSDGTTVGGEFQLNSTVSGGQERVRIDVMSDDSYVVTFQSLTSAGNLDIRARRFDSDDTPLDGSDFQVNTYTTSSQAQPDIAVLADGSFVVTWESAFQDWVTQPGGSKPLGNASANGIYAQKFSSNGTPMGSEFRVNDTLDHAQDDPTITSLGPSDALPSGGYAVVWSSQTNNAGVAGPRDVFIKIYDVNGVAQTAEIKVNSFEANDQQQPFVEELADGTMFVAWSSNGQDADGFALVGRRVEADGTLAGEDFQINTSEANDQTLPTLGALDGGGFVAFWQTQIDAGGGGGSNIETIAGRLFGPNISGMRDLTGGEGNDYVAGSDQVDTIETLGGSDQLFGFANDDILIGGTGADLMEGGAGADTFVWNDIGEAGFGGLLDSIGDFSTIEGDKLDVSAFVTLSGGDDINDFVNLIESGGSTTVRIDVDGAAGGTNFVSMVLLENAAGLDPDDLLTNGNLLVTQI